MLHDCFRNVKFTEMKQMIGEEVLAFNLLMPNQSEYKEPRSLSVACLFFVSIVFFHAFLFSGLDTVDAWVMVSGTMPYILIGTAGYTRVLLNKKEGMKIFRTSSLHPSGTLMWLLLGAIELALIISALRFVGLLHSLFLFLGLLFASIIVWAMITIGNAYAKFDFAYDRFRWLALQIPNEKVRQAILNHHRLEGQIRYQHDYYHVPQWSDEEIDRLIEISWRKKKADFYGSILGTVLFAGLILIGSSVKGFRQFNGILLPFGEGKDNLSYSSVELSLLVFFLASVYTVFNQRLSFSYVLGMFFFHILFSISDKVSNLIHLLTIGYVFILWQSVKNSRNFHDQKLIDRYKREFLWK